MNKTGFTKEQMEILRLNPSTSLELYLQGVQPEDIFRQSGYDPDLVGKKRIINTTHSITSHRAASTCNSEDVNYARLVCEVKALGKGLAVPVTDSDSSMKSNRILRIPCLSQNCAG